MIGAPSFATQPPQRQRAISPRLAREERAGRRPRRLLDPNLATCQRFRGRLGARDLAEMLLEDAAVTQPEPFVAAILGRDDPFERVPEPLIEGWLAELPSAPLDTPLRHDIEVRITHGGMDVAVDEEAWVPFQSMPAGDLATRLNYTARGERVQPSAGVYWIPATAFSQVVAAARTNPAVLNCYRFVAVATTRPRCSRGASHE